MITLFVSRLAALLLASQAATAVTISEFPIPATYSQPEIITVGPDGNLWFTDAYNNAIGRITTTGIVTEFAIPTPNSNPRGIASGPDGNLWFTEFVGKIGRITADGEFTEFTSVSTPLAITSGPDGNLWFTEIYADKIGRITPSGSITEFTIRTVGCQPAGITSGPDGNLWFVEASPSANKVGRITPSGAITEFTIPTPYSYPWTIASGPDGNLWFPESGLRAAIGRITPSGTITEFALPDPNCGPSGIVSGPDGNLWFTEIAGNAIGRITIAGSVTEFALPTRGSDATSIVSGPDGNLWFTEFAGRIGRLSPALSYYLLSPCRALDTRRAAAPLGGPALAPNELRSFPFAGACGIPSDAVVVSANLTTVAPSAAGNLRVYRTDGPTTGSSMINFNAGRTRANNSLVGLSLDGAQSVTIQNDSTGDTDVVFDVNGYFK